MFLQLHESYSGYKTEHGLIGPAPGKGSGNGIRFTAEAMFVHKYYGNLDELMELGLSIKRCINHEPWYLRRQPGGEPTGIDDYVSAIFADYLAGLDIARRFLDHAHNQNYIMGPDEYDFRFFMGRYLQLFCIANWVAGRKPSLAQELFWMIAVFQGAAHKGQDEKVLSWMLIRIGQGRRWIFKPLIWFWRKQLKKHYGEGGIGEVIGRYFQNHEHPNAKYLRGVGV